MLKDTVAQICALPRTYDKVSGLLEDLWNERIDIYCDTIKAHVERYRKQTKGVHEIREHAADAIERLRTLNARERQIVAIIEGSHVETHRLMAEYAVQAGQAGVHSSESSLAIRYVTALSEYGEVMRPKEIAFLQAESDFLDDPTEEHLHETFCRLFSFGSLVRATCVRCDDETKDAESQIRVAKQRIELFSEQLDAELKRISAAEEAEKPLRFIIARLKKKVGVILSSFSRSHESLAEATTDLANDAFGKVQEAGVEMTIENVVPAVGIALQSIISSVVVISVGKVLFSLTVKKMARYGNIGKKIEKKRDQLDNHFRIIFPQGLNCPE